MLPSSPPDFFYTNLLVFFGFFTKLFSGIFEIILQKGFQECMRVLKPNGVLIFKWNEVEVPISKILHLFGKQPLFGHSSGKRMNTHWVCFMKEE